MLKITFCAVIKIVLLNYRQSGDAKNWTLFFDEVSNNYIFAICAPSKKQHNL